MIDPEKRKLYFLCKHTKRKAQPHTHAHDMCYMWLCYLPQTSQSTQGCCYRHTPRVRLTYVRFLTQDSPDTVLGFKISGPKPPDPSPRGPWRVPVIKNPRPKGRQNLRSLDPSPRRPQSYSRGVSVLYTPLKQASVLIALACSLLAWLVISGRTPWLTFDK